MDKENKKLAGIFGGVLVLLILGHLAFWSLMGYLVYRLIVHFS